MADSMKYDLEHIRDTAIKSLRKPSNKGATEVYICLHRNNSSISRWLTIDSTNIAEVIAKVVDAYSECEEVWKRNRGSNDWKRGVTEMPNLNLVEEIEAQSAGWTATMFTPAQEYAHRIASSAYWPRIRDALLAAEGMEQAWLGNENAPNSAKDLMTHAERFHIAYRGTEE